MYKYTPSGTVRIDFVKMVVVQCESCRKAENKKSFLFDAAKTSLAS